MIAMNRTNGISHLEYRELNKNELKAASSLMWSVFSDYVAPGYVQEGIEAFRIFIQPEELENTRKLSEFFLLGCFEKDNILGVIAIKDLCHVSLLFVEKEHHRQGIAKALYTRAINHCRNQNPGLNAITVHSSPYAVEVYKRLGFQPIGAETTKNGITYIPMKMKMESSPTAIAEGCINKEYYMRRAIELAGHGSGFVNPDTLVGALLVKEDRIIGEGYYREYGAMTAERMAIENSFEELAGAELYLTIEPYQVGQSGGELSNLLKDLGIKKVYIGVTNPNPDRKYDFIKELQRLQIDCEVGLLEKECNELNEIYSHYVKTGTPYVIVKWAMTLDGKLATKTGDSKWISSAESLKFVHLLRQRVAAILVGENTVRRDDPLLTTRLEGVEISNPLRVIISKYGDIPLEAKVLQVDSKTQTLIIASELLPKEKEEELRLKGVNIVKLKEVNNHIDFKDIMKTLGSMGIDSVYIEGGSSILGSAFESGVINKVYTAIAPKIVGGDKAVTPVGGSGIERMNNAIVLERVSHEIVGPDVIIKGYIV